MRIGDILSPIRMLQAITNKMFNIFKKKTELDFLKMEFSFLESDFGYSLIKEENQDYYKGKNLLIYRNNNTQKQIEICGGSSFFHCIIRRIHNQELSKYSNRIDNVGFEDIAIFDNPKYDHFDFYAGGKNGVIEVAKKTSALFKKRKTFFTSVEWIDISQVEFLKNGELNSRFKTVKNNKPDFFIERIKIMIDSEFPAFELVFNNEELPFYHQDSTLERLIYKTKDKQIKIEQYDWRDYREIYTVFLNDTEVKEFDISKFKNQDKAVEEIKKLVTLYIANRAFSG